MKNYQLVLVLRNALTEANRKKLLESVKDMLNGAKFTKEEEWGVKPLSYAINKELSGFYVHYLFEMKENIAKDFEKKLNVNEDILRHLLLRVQK
jgi:small subunit ribosomal protein S6